MKLLGWVRALAPAGWSTDSVPRKRLREASILRRRRAGLRRRARNNLELSFTPNLPRTHIILSGLPHILYLRLLLLLSALLLS